MNTKLLKILLFIIAPILALIGITIVLCVVLIKPVTNIIKPTASNEVYTYTGNEITYNIIKNEAYTVSNDKNTNAGTYTVIVTLVDKNKYKWDDGSIDNLEFTFVINKKKIDKPLSVTKEYTGSEQVLATESAYYDLSNYKKTEVGVYDVVAALKDKSNYEWTDNTNDDYHFTSRIVSKTTETITYSMDAISYEYIGDEIKPEPTLLDEGKTLVKDVDYILSYEANINLGSGKIIVTFINNYSGTLEIPFTITKKVVEKPVLDTNTFTYDGSVLTYNLLESDYYTIRNNKHDQSGTYTVYVELNDKESSTWSDGTTTDLEYEFVINPKSSSSFTVDYDNEFTYSGDEITPAVTVKDGDTTLILDNDYRVAYENNTQSGTSKIIITGINNYKDSKEVEFTIAKAKVNKPIADTNTYTFNYTEQEYIISESTLYQVSGNKKTNAGTTKVIVALSDKNNYTWSDGAQDDLEYDFEIKPKSIEGFNVFNIENQEFNMSEITPKAVIYDNDILTDEDSYDYSYTDNVHVGKATVTITGKGNYTGSLSTTFYIIKKVVEKPVEDMEVYKYTGEEISYNIDTSDTNLYSVTGDYKKKNVGNYTFTVSLKYPEDSEWDDHSNTDLTYSFNILKRDLSDSLITIDEVVNQEYTGTYIKPSIIISIGNTPLVKNQDYYLDYEDNLEIGEAKILINHLGDNISGDTYITFNIVKAKIAIPDEDETVFKYNGKTHKYSIPKSDYYTISGEEEIYAGNYKVELTLNDTVHYEWEDSTVSKQEYDFIIEKRILNDGVTLIIDDSENLTYTGLSIEPTNIKLKIGDYEIPSISYSINGYLDNTLAGTAKIILESSDTTNYYDGEIQLEFAISARNINDCDISSISDQAYQKSPITPEVTISYNSNTIYETIDYELAYSNNTNVGAASITIEGIGNFTGSKTIKFNIVKNSITGAVITLVKESNEFSYLNGNPVTPEIKSVVLGETELILNTDYTVSYSNNTHIGNGLITITGINNYKDTETKTFVILNENYDIAKATVIKEVGTFIYNGEEIKPIVTVKVNDITLTENTDYEVSYSNNINASNQALIVITGINDYGNQKEVTFTINQKEIKESDITIKALSDVIYSGSSFEPAITITDSIGEIASSNYDLAYSNNLNAGEALVSITFKNNYKSNKVITRSFNIERRTISDATYNDFGLITYTGDEITPIPVIKLNGNTLVLNTDYTLSYENNINVSNNAKIYVEGINNYKDILTITFEIEEEVIDYNITYNLNDTNLGTASNDSTNPITYNRLSGVLELKPASLAGYTFVGWKLNNVIVTTIDSKTISGPIELIAEWTLTSYQITFIMNDSEDSRAKNKNTSIYTKDDNKQLINPTRDGYEFIGWTCQELGILTPTLDVYLPYMVSEDTYYYGNITLTANWAQL